MRRVLAPAACLLGLALLVVAARIWLRAPVAIAPLVSADVLLITIDTLRADRLGSYGYRQASTPVLDRLAGEGVRFAHVVVPVPLTLPSHASLMSGQGPLRHAVRDNVGFVVRGDLPTLAHRLKHAGYDTAAFVSAFPLHRRFGLAGGFDYYDDPFTRDGVERRADETVADARAWLSQSTGARERPLFLWVHLFDPHAPYEPPGEYGRDFADRPYDGEVAFVDAQVGLLLSAWRERRGPDGLIVVTADHGEGLGEHGESTHGLFVYDATIRVPLLVAGRGIAGGRVLDTPVRLIDVAPTVLDVLRLPPLENAEGVTLGPLLRGGGARDTPPAYVESLFGSLCCGWAPLHAWRDGRWMLIDAPQVELYDIAADPFQTRNVAGDHPSEVARLRIALQTALKDAPPAVPIASSTDTSDRLRSLGYVSGPRGVKPSNRDPKDMVRISERMGRAIDRLENDPPGAAAELRAVVAEDPSNPTGRRQLALALARAGRAGEAARELRTLVMSGDRSTETVAALATLALDQENWDEARATLESLHARDRSDTEVALKLGIVLTRFGHLERAIDIFRDVVRREPENTQAVIDLAGALLKVGRARESVEFFKRAADLHQAGPLPWNGLAAALLQVGDKAGAAEAMRQSLRRDPNQPETVAALRAIEGERR